MTFQVARCRGGAARSLPRNRRTPTHRLWTAATLALFATRATFVRALGLLRVVVCGQGYDGDNCLADDPCSRSSMHLNPGSDTGTPHTILTIGRGGSAGFSVALLCDLCLTDLLPPLP